MLKNSRKNKNYQPITQLIRKSSLYFITVFIIFICIGILTTVSPAYRFSSHILTNWTSKVESSTFIYLLGMENKAFKEAYPKDKPMPNLSTTFFELITSIKPNDARSLLRNEIPGFSIYDQQILIAGEGTDFTNLPIESSPPLEDVLEDREAIMDEEMDEGVNEQPDIEGRPSTGKRNVVFIYNTHNRESFLPSLPGVTDPDSAHHHEVNVTKISERIVKSLKKQGIGAVADKTDHMQVLNERGWKYPQSYKASREVVANVLEENKDYKYVFDIHRDSLGRDKTTKKINGKSYAKVMFVVGAEHENHEKNLKFASELHYILEEKYPGLSRGVYPKKGKGTNGVFNQDLSEQAILIEFGGVENNWDELNRTADALAEVFSEFYWDAEKVSKEKKEGK